MKGLVSIIIPTFNRAHVIAETLSSVQHQTYQNWECIVVDDGSNDQTVEIVQSFGEKDDRVSVHKRPVTKKKGGNSCRNYGFELSKGTYIQWFDSDDLMHERMIEEKVAVLEEYPEYDFVVCEGVEFVGTDINAKASKWNNIESEHPAVAHITGEISFHTNGPLFRRAFIDNKPLFNERLLRKQEWEYYSRLLLRSSNYYPLRKELYYFRIHGDSINSNNSAKTLRSRIIANNLVFQSLKKNKRLLEEHTYLRKHFLNKYVFLFKLMVSSRQFGSFIYIGKGLVIIGNRQIIWNSFKNFLKNPKILLNLFNITSPSKR